MREYIDIGPGPASEDVAQIGVDDNASIQNRKECRAYINQLRRQFGPEPDGARLSIAGNAHDFGTYYEVRCYYDMDDEKSSDYAYACEEKASEHWDNEARQELGLMVA